MTTTALTHEQHTSLANLWSPLYCANQETVESWLSYLSVRNDEKNIKKINSTLLFLHKNGFEIKDKILAMYNSQVNSNNLLPQFSFVSMFSFLKTYNLAKDEEIPIENILTGIDNRWKKSRFHRDNQIKFLLLFSPSEERVNKLLDCYEFLKNEYTLDLSDQKRLLKTFNSYASVFVKTLEDSKQEVIMQRLDNICMGLNNEDVKNNDISFVQEEEYSFRFMVAVNNQMNDSMGRFNQLKSKYEVIIENLKDESISEVVFKEINNKANFGVLKFQYAFFSHDKNCINQYSQYFKEFNDIIANDILSNNLGKDTYYVDVFKKIAFKNKLLDKYEEKNTAQKTLKI